MQTFPEPGMEPESPAVETLSLNHWATREVPGTIILYPTILIV